LRTLPYLRAWAEKYHEQGLVVIGAHTPEFAFEHDPDHVRQAVQDLDVTYPIAVDSDYKIWAAFGNYYWPALYFVDTRGHIRYHWSSAGSYVQSEIVIQRLLRDAGGEDVYDGFVSLTATEAEGPVDGDALNTRETSVGYWQTTGFASPGGM